VKGKGAMKTYWLNLGEDFELDTPVGTLEGEKMTTLSALGKTSRLIDWNVDVLLHLLRQIVARRKAAGVKSSAKSSAGGSSSAIRPTIAVNEQTVLDEVAEIITLPKFDPKAAHQQEDPKSIKLDEDVIKQLSMFVSSIAAMYVTRTHSFYGGVYVR
jgi:hypothetical protein